MGDSRQRDCPSGALVHWREKDGQMSGSPGGNCSGVGLRSLCKLEAQVARGARMSEMQKTTCSSCASSIPMKTHRMGWQRLDCEKFHELYQRGQVEPWKGLSGKDVTGKV